MNETLKSSSAVSDFCQNNGLLAIIRGHEPQEDGFNLYGKNLENKEFPNLITVFSAPNYCDCYQNKGAILEVNFQVFIRVYFKGLN